MTIDYRNLEIDKKVPIPEKNPRRSAIVEIVQKMKIGDSIHLSDKMDAVTLYNALTRVFSGSKSGRYARVGADDKRGDGWRVWRIK